MTNDGGPALAPPVGYETWLHYAVETMDTRNVYLEWRSGEQPQWS
ncbi:unnamed protein product, partial [marine sediment metagenome]